MSTMKNKLKEVLAYLFFLSTIFNKLAKMSRGLDYLTYEDQKDGDNKPNEKE